MFSYTFMHYSSTPRVEIGIRSDGHSANKSFVEPWPSTPLAPPPPL